MNRFTQQFGTERVLLAVVHVSSVKQARRNVAVALNGGAAGVFLIGHGMRCNRLLDIYKQVRPLFPAAWIGINFLDIKAQEAYWKLPFSI